MRNRLMSSIFVLVVVIGIPGIILAQGDKHPDLSGLWAGPSGAERSKLPQMPPPEPMPLTPRGEADFKYNRDPWPTNGGMRVRAELDPSHYCFPPGLTRLGNPFQIFQSPKKLIIHYETNHEVRRIFTDGRQHPQGVDLDLTWNGDSIGKWDGDTLVVDTIGLRDEQLFDGAGHTHSDKLHVVERFKRIDHDTLQIDTTYEDPVMFTKPFTRHAFLKLKTDWDILPDNICDERYKKAIYRGESPSGL